MTSADRGNVILAFFGCFSPPTNGHLGACAVGADCIESHGYRVEKVVIVPASSHYRKPGLLPGAVRLALCRFLSAAAPYIEIEDSEVLKDSWSRTIDTLNHLQQRYPDRRILLLCGIDVVDSFERGWRRPDIEKILRDYGLVVLPRGGTSIGDIVTHSSWLEGQNLENLYCAESNPVEFVSSSLVREKLSTGKRVSGLLLPEVERYLHENGLLSPQ
jgi:nicotinate (nicotinamide) nucleotide adenylyltransferase